MAREPQYNVSFSYWYSSQNPAVDPPAGTFMGQLYIMSRGNNPQDEPTPGPWTPTTIVRISVTQYGLLALPLYKMYLEYHDTFQSIDWGYYVYYWDFMHKNFDNEYVALYVVQATTSRAIPDHRR